MKPTFKVLIVANNTPWASWPLKVSWLQNFFQPIANLQIDVKQTTFPSVPMQNFTAWGTQYEVLTGIVSEVAPSWYANNITPLAKGYDVSMLVLPESEWPVMDCIRGATTLGVAGPIPCEIASDENEATYLNGVELFATAEHYMAHELSHALFQLAGIAFASDTTHYWDFAQKNLSGVLADIKLKPVMTPTEAKIYEVLKEKLGTHLTLNNNVPAEVGCAECASTIFKLSGFTMPTAGIESTLSLLQWAQANPHLQEISQPEQGAFIINATSTGNGTVEGHCGFLAAYGVMYVGDYGICSNDSNTGTLREQWNYQNWVKYYEVAGGMKTHIFRAL